ncbi:unnamed protein product, partial [Closterium sp. NIES-54]
SVCFSGGAPVVERVDETAEGAAGRAGEGGQGGALPRAQAAPAAWHCVSSLHRDGVLAEGGLWEHGGGIVRPLPSHVLILSPPLMPSCALSSHHAITQPLSAPHFSPPSHIPSPLSFLARPPPLTSPPHSLLSSYPHNPTSCQLANRRRLARLAAEEAERQAALGEGRGSEEGPRPSIPLLPPAPSSPHYPTHSLLSLLHDSLQPTTVPLSYPVLLCPCTPLTPPPPFPTHLLPTTTPQVVQALLHEGRPMEAECLVETALSRNLPKPMRKQLQSAIAEEASGMLQFEVARAIISEQPHSIRGWSLFHSLTLRGTESNDRRAKFLQQMRMRHPACVAAVLVSGHHHALRGHMQGACREYLRAHRLQPHDPLICLCCGVALLNLSLGSRLRDRSQCVLQGMALLQQYAQLSGDTQEVHFNLGRAFHHVGLLHLAVDHYKRVLSSTTSLPHIATTEQPGSRVRRSRDLNNHEGQECDAGLKQEAAHNLVAIYRNSGADALARQVMRSYLTI